MRPLVPRWARCARRSREATCLIGWRDTALPPARAARRWEGDWIQAPPLCFRGAALRFPDREARGLGVVQAAREPPHRRPLLLRAKGRHRKSLSALVVLETNRLPFKYFRRKPNPRPAVKSGLLTPRCGRPLIYRDRWRTSRNRFMTTKRR